MGIKVVEQNEKVSKGKVSSGNPLFTYIDSKEYGAIINENNVPRIFGRGGIFICLKGEGDVIINEHKYQLSPGTLCIAFPGTIIPAMSAHSPSPY